MSSPTIATAAPSRGPRRRAFRRVLIAAEAIILLLIFATLGTIFYLRHALHASLPQLDGDLHVAGLSAPATVTRDDHGVPSIHAASLDDLLFTQGYITASDRLWQMDALRRHGAGELAEILGPSLIEHDRRQRYLLMRVSAERALTVLPADQLHQLDVYTRGVNAFIDSHPDNLPVEFHALHYKPAPWTPRDSLLIALVMAQDLTTSFPQKLNREALTARLPADLITDMYPVGSWRDRPPTQSVTDLTAPVDVPEIPLDDSQSSMRPHILGAPSSRPPLGARVGSQDAHASPHDLLTTFAELSRTLCEGCRAGSNDWVVAGSRSASGASLLSDDMHLSLAAPGIWYEAALHITPSAGATGSSFDVTGFTLPGVPFVIVGRNQHVAWGFTNVGSDVQDIYIEHLRGSGDQTEFERPDGDWSTAAHHFELIRVRGGHDVSLDILTTAHTIGTTLIETPIISPLYRSERRALSLAWNVYDPSTVTAPFLAINSAQDAASLVAAFAGFGTPSQNLVYADAQHIGYHALGRVPIRGEAVQHAHSLPALIAAPASAPAERNDDSEDNSPPADVQAVAPALDYTIGSPISFVPVDALDLSQQWSGYIPYDKLPAITDPASGVIATANARITPDNYPYYLTDDWADPYRVERIRKLLDGRYGLTPAAMLAIQTDVHSEFDLFVANRLAYAIDHASPSALHNDSKRLHQAADLMRTWNGDLTPNSAAGTIVVAARSELWPMLLNAQLRAHGITGDKDIAELSLLYTWEEKNTALENLLQHQPERWLAPPYTNWNDMLTASVAHALRQAPRDLESWHYGDFHPVEIAHPIFGSRSVLSDLLGTHTGTGIQATGGDASTVKAAGLHFGPSERFTADLSNADATAANITTGESGNPTSPYYLDQFLAWLHGTTYALPLNHPVVAHTLKLTPN
jgi:penicillin amidase